MGRGLIPTVGAVRATTLQTNANMKSKIFYAIALFALLATSCQKDKPVQEKLKPQARDDAAFFDRLDQGAELTQEQRDLIDSLQKLVPPAQAINPNARNSNDDLYWILYKNLDTAPYEKINGRQHLDDNNPDPDCEFTDEDVPPQYFHGMHGNGYPYGTYYPWAQDGGRPEKTTCLINGAEYYVYNYYPSGNDPNDFFIGYLQYRHSYSGAAADTDLFWSTTSHTRWVYYVRETDIGLVSPEDYIRWANSPLH